MEQPKPKKRMLTVRLAETGYDHIAKRAAEFDVPVSTIHRWMLAYASANMPRDWTPGRVGR